MTLVDTLVWVDHLRRCVPPAGPPASRHVACHPFVIGELALGGLRCPAETIALLSELPQVSVSAHEDVLRFVAEHRLGASGIGWIDAHLLCAALNYRIPVWTWDRNLQAVGAARSGGWWNVTVLAPQRTLKSAPADVEIHWTIANQGNSKWPTKISKANWNASERRTSA